MAQKKELVQFSVQNNTDCDINVPLLQRNIYSINATTKYSWNIQTIDLSCGSGSIVVNGATYPLSYTANSLASFLSALNNLGFGFFCTETISSVNYLYTQDDTNVYGTINDCASGSTTTTTTTTTTAAPTTSTTTTSTTLPATSTTTTTTTAAPTTSTTTTTTTAIFNVDVNVASEAVLSPSANVKVKFSIDGGATWSDYGAPLDPSTGFPNYNSLSGLSLPSGTNVLIGITDSSDANIQYGSGQFSSDFTSLCGLSSPFVITNLSANANIYLNVAVSGGALVPCSATTTTTTTTTTAAPTTSTTTTSTTAPATSTTTTTTTAAPTTSTTTTTTTAAPTTSTTTTTTTAAPTTSTTTTTTTAAPTTSTTTTTTTAAPTTSTTTTTTTAAPFNFNLSNTSLDVSVTQLDYNGTTATVTAGSMPNIPSANTQLLQNEVGSFTVLITYNSSIGGQHITITDSNGTITCQGTSVGTGLTLSYASVVWDGSTPIQVDILDGAC
jgi:hypothetical protein